MHLKSFMTVFVLLGVVEGGSVVLADPPPAAKAPAAAVSPAPHRKTFYIGHHRSANPADDDLSETHYVNHDPYSLDLRAGWAALRANNPILAEADFRESFFLLPEGDSCHGLAVALAAQGKTEEALSAYRRLFQTGDDNLGGGTYMTQAQLEYAILLSQSGDWKGAVAVFKTAVPDLHIEREPSINLAVDMDHPEPALLEAAAHVGLGLYANAHGDDLGNDASGAAFREYGRALQLAPEWDAANYYYGYGWQRLDPAERARLGMAQQAKAALQKAVKIGNGPVKAAAQKALQVAMKP